MVYGTSVEKEAGQDGFKGRLKKLALEATSSQPTQPLTLDSPGEDHEKVQISHVVNASYVNNFWIRTCRNYFHDARRHHLHYFSRHYFHHSGWNDLDYCCGHHFDNGHRNNFNNRRD